VAAAGGVRAAGATVLCVTPSRPVSVAGLDLPAPVLCDPDRAAYRAFGLEPGGWGMFFRPRVLGRYLRLMFAGWRPHAVAAGEDPRQLGGDFVLSADRRVLFVYRSGDPADRPIVDDLIRPLTRPPAGAAP
jgi:hypothetical protein